VGKTLGQHRLILTVGAAEGCDLLILLFGGLQKIAGFASSYGPAFFPKPPVYGGRAVSDCYVGKKL
jgi:hypothetical protein